MKASPKDQQQANQLLGELEFLLDNSFLNACYLGAMYKANPAPALTAFTLLTAKGEGAYGGGVVNDAVLCHDALCKLIKQGQPLSTAAGNARREEKVREAFERYQDGHLNHALSKSGQMSHGETFGSGK